jgi:hypothetical protein
MKEGRMDGWGTYTTSDAEARTQNRDKERNGDEYTRNDVTEPIDLVHGYTEFCGSYETKEGDGIEKQAKILERYLQ